MWPAMLIGQFAVDKKHRGKGLSYELMTFAFQRAVELSRLSGSEYIILHALPNVVELYKKFGFLILPKQDSVTETVLMYIEMSSVTQILAQADGKEDASRTALRSA